MDRVGHPSEVVSVGETLALRVISLDMERHRIGLSLEKVDSADYAAIDFEQIQEELGEEDLDEILAGSEASGDTDEGESEEIKDEMEEEPSAELQDQEGESPPLEDE